MSEAERYGLDLSKEHTTGCPRCIRNSRDNSRNNLRVYGEGKGAYCWACEFTILSEEEREARGLTGEEEQDEEVSTREKITPEENEQLKAYTGTKGHDYRGLRDDITKKFGVRYEYDPESGEPVKQYVPTTVGYELAGYRTRRFPKDFSEPVGQVGKECDMVGEFLFKTGSRRVCIISGGEVKTLATYQIMSDNIESKGKTGDWDVPAVVCSTLGESGAWKQVQSRYEFFKQFDKIVVCMDADKAGEEGAEKIAKILPKGKVFIMKMRLKDADSYIKAGREKDFMKDYWDAKPWTPSGIVAAGDIYQEIVARAGVDRLPLPPMLKKLNKALAGGVNYGYIVNILAGSGAGKSSFVNQCTAFWMQDLGVRIGVVSLEAEAAEYGENLLSHTIGRKISLIEDKEERIQFVSSQATADAAKSLFMKADGSPLLYLLDDRGDYSKLQESIEELVIACDIRVVVIDVISDVFAGASLETIDLWMAWEKKMVKQYNCIIINVAHTRKGSSDGKSASQGKALTEESIIGSGTQYRSAGINIALQRDKTAEDEVERNTTYVHLLKSRATGVTGVICELYYEGSSHTLWDKEEYMALHPQVF